MPARRYAGQSPLRVPFHEFGWDPGRRATLEHSTLPWFGATEPEISFDARGLDQAGRLGSRDRLSLLGQFAAHQAFLQFAGIADAEFDVTEWAVVRKRGNDCRLIRIAARMIPFQRWYPTIVAAAPSIICMGIPRSTLSGRSSHRMPARIPRKPAANLREPQENARP